MLREAAGRLWRAFCIGPGLLTKHLKNYYISTKRYEIQPPWSARGRRPPPGASSGRFGQLEHRRRADGDARGDLAFGNHPDRGGGAGDAEGAACSKALIEGAPASESRSPGWLRPCRWTRGRASDPWSSPAPREHAASPRDRRASPRPRQRTRGGVERSAAQRPFNTPRGIR